MNLSNNPLLDADLIPDSLATRYPKLVTRLNELKDGFERFPATVEDAETAEKSVLFEKMMGAFITEAEKAHESEKAPYLASGRAVDNFFLAGMKKIVEPWKKTVNQRRTNYQAKVAEEERKARVKAMLEARAAEEAAVASMQTESDLDKAIEVAETAVQAVQEVQDFSAKEIGRIKTEVGVTASLTYEWVGEIEHMDVLDLAPLRAFLGADAIQKALNQYIKINKGMWMDDDKPHIHGCKIYRKPKSVTR